ncbi:MAG: hypothetical protein KAR42_16215 [candidate division Zixibacteria bacterium]|nr:hypothetical protein [candidate division Zixibacteria bacterium]
MGENEDIDIMDLLVEIGQISTEMESANCDVDCLRRRIDELMDKIDTALDAYVTPFY